MRQRTLLLMFLLMVGRGALEVNAQNLYVKTKDGTKKSLQVSTIEKLGFSDVNTLQITGNTTKSYSVSVISKLYFNSMYGDDATVGSSYLSKTTSTQSLAIPTDTTSNTLPSDVLALIESSYKAVKDGGTTSINNYKITADVTASIAVYPNPVRDIIYFKNLPEGFVTALIYRTNGSVVMRTTVSSNSNSINVSNLPNGIYQIIVGGQAVKFIKL